MGVSKIRPCIEGEASEFRKWDVAVKFALDMSICSALSQAIPQGKCRVDRKIAVGNMH